MKKRILSVLLCLVMVVGMLPTVAFAADNTTVKTIMLGTGGIKDPEKKSGSDYYNYQSGFYYEPKSYIYFGNSIKWRVLDADKDNNGTTNRMFLLSEYLLTSGVKWYDNPSDGNDYQNSKAQKWCGDYAKDFSTQEEDVMLATTKSESENTTYKKMGNVDVTLAPCSLSGDKLFLLSAKELADYVGNYSDAPGFAASPDGGSLGIWWLRSPIVDNSYRAGAVGDSGYMTEYDVINGFAARPAFNLDSSKILFTSAAVDGKADATVDSNLTAVNSYSGNEWKLTLKDDSRSSFSVTQPATTTTVATGGSVKLEYSGATTGDNEYISAMLMKSDEVLYYGRVLNTKGDSSAAGEVSITIPTGIEPGSYTLKVFNEQYNGDKKTDYASEFKNVSLTVTYAEAKIGENRYTTLGDALDAASENDAADTIEIVRGVVTLNADTKTLEAGDSIKLFKEVNESGEPVCYGEVTAKTGGATLAVYAIGEHSTVKFTSGEVTMAADSRAYLGDGVKATGTSGKTITNPAASGSDVITVATGANTDTVTVLASGTVTIDQATYINASSSEAMVIDVTASGNKLTSGTVKLSPGASISGEGATIKGVAKTGTGNDTTVEKDSTDGSLTLIAGAGSVTGAATVNAKLSGEKTVAVTVPAEVTATIDLNNTPPEVKNLEEGKSVTIDGVKYTAVTGSVFPLNSCKLTKDGETATVLGTVTDNVTVAASDALSITVPGSNTGDVTIEKTATGAEVTIAEENGTFTVNAKTYIAAGSAGAKFAVGTNGGVTLESGSVKIGDGVSITGKSGKAITNPTGSGSDVITVTTGTDTDTVTVLASGTVTIDQATYINASSSKAMVIDVTTDGNTLTSGSVKFNKGQAVKVGNVTVTNTGDADNIITVNSDKSVVVPANGKATIGGIEYEAGNNGATFVIGADGKVSLTSGTAVLGKGDSIIGKSGQLITNPAESGVDEITVAADGEAIKDTVTVPTKGGKVKIGGEDGVEYTTAENNTKIEVTAYGNKLISGAVKFNKDKAVNVGNVTVTDTGDQEIVVKSDGTVTVTVPAEGTLDIGNAKITNVKKDTTFTIGDDNFSVALGKGETVTIDGIAYTGGEGESAGGTLIIGQVTGNANTVSAASGSKVIATMNANDTINIANGKVGDKSFTSPLPFTATNSGASIVIDSTDSKNPNTITGNGRTYLSLVYDKNPDGTYNTESIIGYTVTKKSSSSSTTTDKNTTTNSDGSTTTTEIKSDGTKVEATTYTDASGSTGTTTTVTDKTGATTVKAEAEISTKAVETAQKENTAVTIPVEVKATTDVKTAPTVEIKIDVKSSGSTDAVNTVKVEVPVTNVDSGTVAVIVKADGTEEVVKTTLPTENGVTISVSGNVTVKIVDNSRDFIDTRNHWSRDEVNFVASREIFNGVGNNTFGVAEPTTRGMVNTVLARLAGEDTTGGATWYEKGTEWAVRNEISDGTNPTALVTREQLATMLYRYVGSPEVNGDIGFSDSSAISEYAQKALLWATQSGVMNGMGDGTVAPSADAERAQVAAMMARFLKNMN